MILIFLFISFLYADSSFVMKAKTASDLLQQDQLQNKVSTLQGRCEAEVKGGFLPVHCYQWLAGSNESASNKQRLLNWFDDLCEKKLKEDFESPRFHLRVFPQLGLRCQKAMQVWVGKWTYKLQKERSGELFKYLKVGNQIVLEKPHETPKVDTKYLRRPSRALR